MVVPPRHKGATQRSRVQLAGPPQTCAISSERHVANAHGLLTVEVMPCGTPTRANLVGHIRQQPGIPPESLATGTPWDGPGARPTFETFERYQYLWMKRLPGIII